MTTGISKAGNNLTYSLEETEYYETLRSMYADILEALKEFNDESK